MSIKVYFPNFIFTMIRSGKRRDPNQVVFRVPSILTKPDISQYLSKIYNLNVTNVHTVNFIAHESKARRRYSPAYKNAIVTYNGPVFQYPSPPESSLLKFPRQDAGPVKFPKIC
jgi:ribosomal protein L23